MSLEIPELVWGPLLTAAGPLPLSVHAFLGDLRQRFLAKGKAGRGYRYVSRNGRVLLAAEVPLAELVGRPARVRLQVWHRVILRGDVPGPFGVLIHVRTVGQDGAGRRYDASLELSGAGAELAVDVGGGMVLVFRPRKSQEASSG